MTLRNVVFAAIIGSVPHAIIYAMVGAFVVNFDSTIFAFGVVILVTTIYWIIGRRFQTIGYIRKHDSQI